MSIRYDYKHIQFNYSMANGSYFTVHWSVKIRLVQMTSGKWQDCYLSLSELEIHTDKPLFYQDNDLTNSSGLCLFFLTEIEKVQKDEDNEDEKFIDVVINKNMKLGQKILIPVKQFPKVSTTKLFFQCIMW